MCGAKILQSKDVDLKKIFGVEHFLTAYIVFNLIIKSTITKSKNSSLGENDMWYNEMSRNTFIIFDSNSNVFFSKFFRASVLNLVNVSSAFCCILLNLSETILTMFIAPTKSMLFFEI